MYFRRMILTVYISELLYELASFGVPLVKHMLERICDLVWVGGAIHVVIAPFRTAFLFLNRNSSFFKPFDRTVRGCPLFTDELRNVIYGKGLRRFR